MNTKTFEETLKSLILAEALCISQMTELMFEERPTKERILRGYVLVNDLWTALADALTQCNLPAPYEITHKRLQLLAHCNITHCESLQLLDRLLFKCQRGS
jgi:hypothetical protein